MDTCGIIVAAGSGSRFGVPKQFETVAGARLVDRAVDAVADACDDVVLVLPAGVAWDGRPVAASVPGGSTRSASVRAGLDAVAGSAAVVVVHDAARPLAPPALFEAVIGAVRARSRRRCSWPPDPRHREARRRRPRRRDDRP